MSFLIVRLFNKVSKYLYSTIILVLLFGFTILYIDAKNTVYRQTEDTVNTPVVKEFPEIEINGSPFKGYINPETKIKIEKDFAEKSLIVLEDIPEEKVITDIKHVFQTFNNCGPSSLSMVFSHFGIYKDQVELGNQLRPYQNIWGDNDDKSVSLQELKSKAEEYGFIAYHKPLGDINKLQHFIANDMPVITRTWVDVDDDIGHFRVVKGYNSSEKYLVQDDSLQGHDIKYSYSKFNELWKKFNYEYLVIVPKEKDDIAREILGEDIDDLVVWEKAEKLSKTQLDRDLSDVYARFNLSVAYYKQGKYKKAITEYEYIEKKLAPRTLWYQIEPILAFYEYGDYDKVFEISENIINNENRAYSELYILRGNIYMKQNNEDLAIKEFKKAVLYNSEMDFEYKYLVNQ